MKFTKMHGIGNDYVYINAFETRIDDPAGLAVRLSDRHCGIGSDGLILIAPSSVADVRMIMFNSDGSESAMCGNGIRCVGKYVHDAGMVDKTVLTVETGAGVKTLTLYPENGKVKTVRVDMGEPELRPALIPMVGHDSEATFVNRPLEADGRVRRVTAVSMGNPHAVIFPDPDEDLAAMDLQRLGPIFERHPLFPQRTNTEFVRVEDRTRLAMRVWERGAGETLACGTGACAAVVAAALNGLCDRAARVRLARGHLDIEWSEADNHVRMTGEATTVFTGEMEL